MIRGFSQSHSRLSCLLRTEDTSAAQSLLLCCSPMRFWPKDNHSTGMLHTGQDRGGRCPRILLFVHRHLQQISPCRHHANVRTSHLDVLSKRLHLQRAIRGFQLEGCDILVWLHTRSHGTGPQTHRVRNRNRSPPHPRTVCPSRLRHRETNQGGTLDLNRGE